MDGWRRRWQTKKILELAEKITGAGGSQTADVTKFQYLLSTLSFDFNYGQTGGLGRGAGPLVPPRRHL